MKRLKREYYQNIFPYFVNVTKMPTKDYYFIVSSGRTGTTFLSKYFNQHFNHVLSVHEPQINVKTIWQRFVNKDISLKESKTLFLAYRRDLYINKGKNANIIIESNPSLSLLLPILKDLFENPKIIYITRDPKTYTRSAFDKIPQVFNPNKLFYSQEDESSRLTPNYFNSQSEKNKWRQMERIEKICWYWNKINKCIYDSLKDYDNSLIIKFEDIFQDDNSSTIKKMSDFLELEEYRNIDFKESLMLFKNKINDNQKYRLNEDFSKWNKKDQIALTQYTSEMSKILGYK